jgi:flagellar biosynthetic protein FliR
MSSPELTSLFDIIERATGYSPAFLLGVLALLSARILPTVFLAPFLGGQKIPMRAKVALSLALAAIALPGHLDQVGEESVRLPSFVFLALKEVFIGFMLGYIAALGFLAVQSAGRYLDTAMGNQMAQVLAPQTETQVSPLGQLKFQLVVVVFVLLGGHRLFLEAVFDSFTLLPVDSSPTAAGVQFAALQAIRLSGRVLALTLQLVAPAAVTVFLVDVVLGILNRVAPQINVFFLGMPLKPLVGLFVLAITFAYFMRLLPGTLAEIIGGVRDLFAGVAPVA